MCLLDKRQGSSAVVEIELQKTVAMSALQENTVLIVVGVWLPASLDHVCGPLRPRFDTPLVSTYGRALRGSCGASPVKVRQRRGNYMLVILVSR